MSVSIRMQNNPNISVQQASLDALSTFVIVGPKYLFEEVGKGVTQLYLNRLADMVSAPNFDRRIEQENPGGVRNADGLDSGDDVFTRGEYWLENDSLCSEWTSMTAETWGYQGPMMIAAYWRVCESFGVGRMAQHLIAEHVSMMLAEVVSGLPPAGDRLSTDGARALARQAMQAEEQAGQPLVINVPMRRG